jgi:uncharacterized membrane protein YhfC
MVSTLSMIFMAVSVLIAVGLPTGLFLFLRKKYGLKLVPMLVGAVMFFVFALVLEQMLHMLVLRPSADGAIALRSYPALYVLYGVFAAGIFEETARFIAFSFLKKRYDGIGTGLSYGIGHGGIEAILLLGVATVNNLVLSVMINEGSLPAPGDSPQIAAAIEALTNADSFMFLIGGFERASAIVIQISLSLLVWLAVNKGANLLFPAAVVLHALVDVPAILLQIGVLNNILVAEIILVASAAALAAIAFLACKKLAPDHLLWEEPADEKQ